MSDVIQYEVESIVGARRCGASADDWEYHVKWYGYPASEDTWEPTTSFLTCDTLLERFWEHIGEKRRSKAKDNTIFKAKPQWIKKETKRRKREIALRREEEERATLHDTLSNDSAEERGEGPDDAEMVEEESRRPLQARSFHRSPGVEPQSRPRKSSFKQAHRTPPPLRRRKSVTFLLDDNQVVPVADENIFDGMLRTNDTDVVMSPPRSPSPASTDSLFNENMYTMKQGPESLPIRVEELPLVEDSPSAEETLPLEELLPVDELPPMETLVPMEELPPVQELLPVAETPSSTTAQPQRAARKGPGITLLYDPKLNTQQGIGVKRKIAYEVKGSMAAVDVYEADKEQRKEAIQSLPRFSKKTGSQSHQNLKTSQIQSESSPTREGEGNVDQSVSGWTPLLPQPDIPMTNPEGNLSALPNPQPNARCVERNLNSSRVQPHNQENTPLASWGAPPTSEPSLRVQDTARASDGWGNPAANQTKDGWGATAQSNGWGADLENLGAINASSSNDWGDLDDLGYVDAPVSTATFGQITDASPIIDKEGAEIMPPARESSGEPIESSFGLSTLVEPLASSGGGSTQMPSESDTQADRRLHVGEDSRKNPQVQKQPANSHGGDWLQGIDQANSRERDYSRLFTRRDTTSARSFSDSFSRPVDNGWAGHTQRRGREASFTRDGPPYQHKGTESSDRRQSRETTPKRPSFSSQTNSGGYSKRPDSVDRYSNSDKGGNKRQAVAEKTSTNLLHSLDLNDGELQEALSRHSDGHPCTFSVWWTPSDGSPLCPGLETQQMVTEAKKYGAKDEDHTRVVDVVFVHVGARATVLSMPKFAEMRTGKTLFFTYGSHPSVPQESWGIREMYPFGGLLTFTPSALIEDDQRESEPLIPALVDKLQFLSPLWRTIVHTSHLGAAFEGVLKHYDQDSLETNHAAELLIVFFSALLKCIQPPDELGLPPSLVVIRETLESLGNRPDHLVKKWIYDKAFGSRAKKEFLIETYRDAYKSRYGSIAAVHQEGALAETLHDSMRKDIKHEMLRMQSHPDILAQHRRFVIICATTEVQRTACNDGVEWLTIEQFSATDGHSVPSG